MAGRGTLSIGREAIQQAVAARALEIILGAATAGTAGWMRRIPRLGGRALVEPGAVGMPYHCHPLTALGPVAAGTVVSSRKRRSIRLRAGENVVHVRCIAATVDDL